MKVRRVLKERLHRGHIEVTLSLERTGGEAFSINRELVGGYLVAFRQAAEEFGVSAEPDLNAVLLVLYLLLIGRGMMITANASTMFARLIAGAVTLMFFTYAFVNMGMVSGVLPVVGVPLPLVSYGGTALISLFIGLGLLMSVQAHRKLVHT